LLKKRSKWTPRPEAAAASSGEEDPGSERSEGGDRRSSTTRQQDPRGIALGELDADLVEEASIRNGFMNPRLASRICAASFWSDAPARPLAAITDPSFGPEYDFPGLPHQTRRGIRIDGHEWTTFVRNKTPLAPSLWFSDKPMFATYGEFGARLEGFLHVTGSDARSFTEPNPAIDEPFGPGAT